MSTEFTLDRGPEIVQELMCREASLLGHSDRQEPLERLEQAWVACADQNRERRLQIMQLLRCYRALPNFSPGDDGPVFDLSGLPR